MTSSQPEPNNILMTDDRSSNVIVLTIFTIIGSFGNCLVIFMVMLNRQTCRTSNYYILSLTIADLILCAVVFPFQALVNTRQEEPPWCGFIGGLTQFILTISVFSITAIAINRYLLVKLSPTAYHKKYSHTRTAFSIIMIWVLALVTLIPGFFCYSGYSQHYALCLLTTEKADHGYFAFIYHVVISIVLGVPSIIIIAFSYFQVWKMFQRSIGTIQQFNHRNVRNYRLTRNLFFLTLVFIISWTPEFIIECVDYDFHLPHVMSRTTILLALANSVINPFLYAFLNKRHLNTCKLNIPCLRKKNQNVPAVKIKTVSTF